MCFKDFWKSIICMSIFTMWVFPRKNLCDCACMYACICVWVVVLRLTMSKPQTDPPSACLSRCGRINGGHCGCIQHSWIILPLSLSLYFCYILPKYQGGFFCLFCFYPGMHYVGRIISNLCISVFCHILSVLRRQIAHML